MYTFSYDPKEKIVYMMIGGSKARTSFRSDSDIVESTTEVARHLQPLRESKKMKEEGWKSRYFWELPYEEDYEFMEWLKANFNGSRWHFFVKPYVGFGIRVSFSKTHNEVGEPFLDCEACLPKSVLAQVCDLILHEWENHVRQED